ncbi:MAG TPA: hypothetical protein VNA89_12175 [Gemmatimonadaceae bacterium]|nr:hypothetical protein [Gemmatimonadaceae bacterium]
MLQNLATSIHTVTREPIIRRFLALDVGEPCNELRRTESERILRAQPFLADASITAFDDGAGGVHLRVRTTDEVSLIVGGGLRGTSPYVTGLKLGNANFGGEAVLGWVEWRHGPVQRDSYAARVVDYQVLGRPYQLALEGARRDLGSSWLVDARHPFFTDLQRVAWRVTTGSSDEFLPFLRPGADPASLRLERRFVDVGGIVRLGAPGRLSLFGVSVTREDERPGVIPVVIRDSAVVIDTSTALIGRYRTHETARINALWGVRNLRYIRVSGFDALRGSQDVRLGFQLGTMFGRGLSVIGALDDDIFVAGDLYVGAGNRAVFGGFYVAGEGRQDYATEAWDGILSTGRAAGYARLSDAHTATLSAEWSGGWRQRVPFQLALGETEGGVRGYGGSKLAGGKRLVLRAEDRWYLGRYRSLSDFGVAAYVDAGRLWANDAPFGVTTPAKVGVGVALLGAAPPNSRRTWRLDIAYPLSPDPDAGWELRATIRDFTRRFWREPRDVRRSRERAVPTSIFDWP